MRTSFRVPLLIANRRYRIKQRVICRNWYCSLFLGFPGPLFPPCAPSIPFIFPRLSRSTRYALFFFPPPIRYFAFPIFLVHRTTNQATSRICWTGYVPVLRPSKFIINVNYYRATTSPNLQARGMPKYGGIGSRCRGICI